MLPGSAMHDFTDSPRLDTVDGCDVNDATTVSAHGFNRLNVMFGKLGPVMLNATMASIAAFRQHVVNVIGLSAERQMGRTNASGVVASMHDSHTARNLAAVGDLPRYAMSQFVPPCRNSELPVSLPARGLHPCPAAVSVGTVHVRPEPSYKCFGHMEIIAGA